MTEPPVPPADQPEPAFPEMSVEELARHAEVPVSTVRMYQHRGLLPAPERRGRQAFYDESHRNRMALIARLQDRGYSLAAIGDLVAGLEQGTSLRGLLGLGDSARGVWTAEDPLTVDIASLADLAVGGVTAEVITRVVEMGLVSLADEPGQVVVHSPSFLEVGRQLAALGVPIEVVLDQYEVLRSEMATVAGRFTDLFRSHLWEPFVDAGQDADRTAALVGRLEVLGTLAESVVGITLRRALQDQAESFLRAEADRLGVDRLGVDLPDRAHRNP